MVSATSLDSEKVRQLTDRARHLTAIKSSPSYPVLKDIIEGKIRAEIRRFIGNPSVPAQQLDYGRGFLRGMQTVLDVIERGEKELERAIKAARLLEDEGA